MSNLWMWSSVVGGFVWQVVISASGRRAPLYQSTHFSFWISIFIAHDLTCDIFSL
jgi:hypothetical protein